MKGFQIIDDEIIEDDDYNVEDVVGIDGKVIIVEGDGVDIVDEGVAKVIKQLLLRLMVLIQKMKLLMIVIEDEVGIDKVIK